MKIAVYIVGQWRGTSYQCAENLKKIFDKFDTDYYIHIWPLYEGKNLNLIQCDVKENPIVEHENYIHTEQDLENIKNTYNNVVSFEVESYDAIKDIKNTHSTFYQYYCAYKANEVRKAYEINNGIKYDVIIKIRPDIIFGNGTIESFSKRIEYIKDNPLTIFSFYTTLKRDMKPNTHCVWDFYTISNTFGMDCMTEWVGEILNKGNEPEIFSSNSVIENNLILNPTVANQANNSPHIMREVFKYNNLIDDFYNQINLYENNFDNINFSLRQVDDYLYNFNIKNNNVPEYFKDINFDSRDVKESPRGLWGVWNKFLTESELKKLADSIKDFIKK
jgi:hypothetical protein